ncbi:CDP-alcohol phosphatidyltransferase family protein [Desulfurivibrio alkaliphilus]|uniref:CDP-diacylglycerol--glycerol-3-phosphate 3-phosphatidyltransferase n=1 Tax=Desulfurivibrio alkaliphilus (strain DSM 19089 / UNIQEM U267 / AHT2) TaxID=589865 RepID=D6Z1S8_DESAT|nr:CDP-alcohol phosphatidyltransferase family protein [Desulfurivibrio alkaliphilus]ADH85503.1 CDP-alcohol phosphatidyltransferase [Desulfurivibrio alkaliphilus AHT 2]
MNIPNLITIIRILLVPLLAIFLLEEKYNLALLVFIIAGISDGLDGFLARLLKQKTRLGAILDPIADKALLITTFIILAVLGVIPQWLTVLVVSRDLLIIIGFGILVLTGRRFQIAPTYSSKLTTVFQLVTVIYFLGLEYLLWLLFLQDYLIIATALVTLVSSAHYLILFFRFMGADDGDKNALIQSNNNQT